MFKNIITSIKKYMAKFLLIIAKSKQDKPLTDNEKATTVTAAAVTIIAAVVATVAVIWAGLAIGAAVATAMGLAVAGTILVKVVAVLIVAQAMNIVVDYVIGSLIVAGMDEVEANRSEYDTAYGKDVVDDVMDLKASVNEHLNAKSAAKPAPAAA